MKTIVFLKTKDKDGEYGLNYIGVYDATIPGTLDNKRMVEDALIERWQPLSPLVRVSLAASIIILVGIMFQKLHDVEADSDGATNNNQLT